MAATMLRHQQHHNALGDKDVRKKSNLASSGLALPAPLSDAVMADALNEMPEGTRRATEACLKCYRVSFPLPAQEDQRIPQLPSVIFAAEMSTPLVLPPSKPWLGSRFHNSMLLLGNPAQAVSVTCLSPGADR